MPALDELDDLTAREAFIKSVARAAKSAPDRQLSVNEGIKTSEELYQHILKGRDVDFDYQRLIDDARTY